MAKLEIRTLIDVSAGPADYTHVPGDPTVIALKLALRVDGNTVRTGEGGILATFVRFARGSWLVLTAADPGLSVDSSAPITRLSAREI